TRSDRDWSSDVCSSDLRNCEPAMERHTSPPWWDVATCYPDGPREGKADRAKRHNADFLLQPFIQALQHPHQVGFAFQHGQHGIRSEERRVGKEWRERRR